MTTGGDALRTFVGVPLIGDARSALLRLQERFRLDIRDQRAVKWERAANLHATIQFLGATPHADLEQIESTLRGTCAEHTPFTLTLDRPQAFGGKKPRIMFVSTGAGSAELTALQADIARGLAAIGYQPDRRPFQPHFTVGRVRRNRKLKRTEADRLNEAHAAVTVGATMDVTEVVFFKSDLTPTGAVHSRIATIPLVS